MRFPKIKIQYEDESLNEKEKDLEGFIARVFQHELDHIKGLTLLNWRLCHLGLEFLDRTENEENKEINDVFYFFFFSSLLMNFLYFFNRKFYFFFIIKFGKLLY